MSESPQPESAPEREPEDVALKRLMRFQFVVLSGLFALGVPGLAVVDGVTENLLYVYPPALLIHGFCLWRMWRLDHGFAPWVAGFVLVVVVMPWLAWGLREWLGLEPLVTAPLLFVAFILIVLAISSRKGA